MNSGIFDGTIRHRRFEPIRREFKYRIFMIYLDLDELPEVMRIHPLWSTRARSPARFSRSDYLGSAEVPLKNSVLNLVEERTGKRPGGPVRLLTHLRFWGVCFNPVSLYYCFDQAGNKPEAVLAEVTNIPWGERHAYVADQRQRSDQLDVAVDKQLHVSPLMGMDHEYRLIFGDPDQRIAVHMESSRESSLYFDATLNLSRRELSRELLGKLLFTRVPMPAKVIGGIHYETARTWLAGARFHSHPRSDESKKRSRCGR